MDQKFKQRYEELTNKEIIDESTLLTMLPMLIEEKDLSTGMIVKQVEDDEGHQFMAAQLTIGVIYKDWFICEEGVYPASFVKADKFTIFDAFRPASIERIQNKISEIVSSVKSREENKDE